MAAPEPSSPKAAGKPQRRHGRLKRFIGCLAVGVVLLALGYVWRAPLLTGLANAWVVNDLATKADAIVVLGGGLENRPFAAAKLFHAGVAPKVLYMDVKLGPAEEIGVGPTEREVTRWILLSNGVPESAIQVIGNQVSSTFDESRAVREWTKQNNATSIVIATDIFHTRRARWIFRHELKDTPVRISMAAVDPVDYRMDNWWMNEEGLIQFQNEVVKSLYYHVKY